MGLIWVPLIYGNHFDNFWGILKIFISLSSVIQHDMLKHVFEGMKRVVPHSWHISPEVPVVTPKRHMQGSRAIYVVTECSHLNSSACAFVCQLGEPGHPNLFHLKWPTNAEPIRIPEFGVNKYKGKQLTMWRLFPLFKITKRPKTPYSKLHFGSGLLDPL